MKKKYIIRHHKKEFSKSIKKGENEVFGLYKKKLITRGTGNEYNIK